jgi:hypothetical protein
MDKPGTHARAWTIRGLAAAFGLAVALSTVAWMALADDIYLTRLATFLANCF